MATATSGPEIYSTTDLAERYGVSGEIIRVTLDRIGLGRRIGRYRLITEPELPTLELALRARGYWPGGAEDPEGRYRTGPEPGASPVPGLS